MADAPIQLLERFLQSARVVAPSDAELLRRYARTRDEAAFAEVVRRHGPMVLGTARRFLGRDPAADDAFQIAFTALARRAGSVRAESVAGWLHRTAVRAATRLRSRQSRSAQQLDAVPGSADDPHAALAWREVRQVLDVELNALPARFRIPLVLCYLEALTRDEAAARLGWSLRTLERRLAQGRGILQERLRRRGVLGVAMGLVAVGGGLTVPVPTALADAVLRSPPLPALSALRAGAWAFGGALLAAGITVALVAQSSVPKGDPAPKAAPPAAARDAVPETAPDVPLPPGAIRRFGSLAWRHPAGISDAALSADGRTLVTFGLGTLTAWDVPTGRRSFYRSDIDATNPFEPGTVAVAPDGSWIAILSRSGAPVRIIDTATGKERLALGPSNPPGGQPRNLIDFRSIHVPADGKVILFCDKKTLFTYDSATGKELRKATLPGRVVAMRRDGNRLAVHDQDNPSVACICDAESGKELVRLDQDFKKPGANSWAIRAAFSGDGSRLGTLSDFGGEVRVWDVETGKQTARFERKEVGPGEDPRLWSVALSADAATLYAGGAHKSGVRRWDLKSGRELDPLPTGHSLVSAVIAGRQMLVTCESEGIIRRWDATTNKELPSPAGHHEPAQAVRSPDGKTVVTADHAGRLLVWSADTGRLMHTIPLDGRTSGQPLAFRPDGRAFACAVQPGRVALFDPAGWEQTAQMKLSDRESAFVHGIAYLPDGSGLIVKYDHDRVERWDSAANRPKWSVAARALALAVSPDGKHFAISTERGVSIRSAADGAQFRLIPVTPDPKSNVAFQIRADALAFSPDGTLVAATRWDEGDVYVWETATGRLFRRLIGHPLPANTQIGETSTRFSCDGRYLATGHADRTARVWELATGKEALRLTGHDTTVSGVSFDRAGRTLLSSAGPEVLLWDLRAPASGRADLEALWNDLGADDAAKAYRAAGVLSRHSDAAIEFLKGKLRPVPAVDAVHTAELVADLDSDRFAAREAATQALAGLGPMAKPALDAGLARGPSAEGRTRIEDLLARLQRPLSGNDVRPDRAVQAVQWVGGEAARALLKVWAAGAAGARLTEQARQALAAADRD